MRAIHVSLVLLGCLTMGALPARAQDDAPTETEITLKLETGAAVGKIITPRRGLYGGVNMSVRGDNGSVDIAGKSFTVVAVRNGKNFGLGLDENGDGEIARNEVNALGRSSATAFKLKLGDDGKTYPLAVVDIHVGAGANGVAAFSGSLLPGWAMKGQLGRETVCLIDANLDGQYTQDGQDAIAIGRSNFALPLHRVHKIGETFYELDVAGDGTKISLKPQSDLSLGKVATNFPDSMLKCLVLINDDGHSYDVSEARRDGIPAGAYRVVYGVLARGNNYAFMLPPNATFDIQADGTNTLRLGPDFNIIFNARRKGESIDIGTGMSVMGAGGEMYRISGEPGRPAAAFYAGKTKVAGGAFSKG